MKRAEEPETRELLQSVQARRSATSAEAAVARLLAGIERNAGSAVDLAAYQDGLRRHGDALRRIGGAALLQAVFNRQCNAVPLQAGRRFDVLAQAWGPIMSRREKL